MQRKHRALGRSILELDTRSPSLVDTSLPLDSVPVVGPLASPLVGNGGGSSAQPSTPTPASGSGESSNGGNGNGSGNGKSGGNGNSGTNGSNGGNGNSEGNGSGGGNGNGVGNGNGGGESNPGGSSGGGNPPPPIASASSGRQITTGPSVPSQTSQSAPGQPSGSSSAKGASSGGNVGGPSSPGVGAGFLGAPANAALSPSGDSLAPGGASAATTNVLSPSQGSASQPVGTATSSAAPTLAAVSPGKELSVGGVAGIAIACLIFLLAFTLLAARRRSIARRLELRRQWWFSRSDLGHNFSFLSRRSPRSTAGSSGGAPPSRLSARSSFATNFDQGLMFRIGSPTGFSLGFDLPPNPPPMAEVRERNCALVSTGASVARRESMNSMLSNGSDPDAQYLAVSCQSNLEPSTPMSVRPFSPSESFAFPKPPAPSSSTVESFFVSGTPALISPQSSATTLSQISTPPRAFIGDLPPPMSATLYSTPNIQLSPFAEEPNSPLDPFADPAKSAEFSEVEVVRRLFVPSLDDELAVNQGDRVHIIRVFDDGWAFVEKVGGIVDERHERGLIPIDCFRQVNQSLPTFLADKRVSYASEKLAYAL